MPPTRTTRTTVSLAALSGSSATTANPSEPLHARLQSVPIRRNAIASLSYHSRTAARVSTVPLPPLQPDATAVNDPVPVLPEVSPHMLQGTPHSANLGNLPTLPMYGTHHHIFYDSFQEDVSLAALFATATPAETTPSSANRGQKRKADDAEETQQAPRSVRRRTGAATASSSAPRPKPTARSSPLMRRAEHSEHDDGRARLSVRRRRDALHVPSPMHDGRVPHGVYPSVDTALAPRAFEAAFAEYHQCTAQLELHPIEDDGIAALSQVIEPISLPNYDLRPQQQQLGVQAAIGHAAPEAIPAAFVEARELVYTAWQGQQNHPSASPPHPPSLTSGASAPSASPGVSPVDAGNDDQSAALSTGARGKKRKTRATPDVPPPTWTSAELRFVPCEPPTIPQPTETGELTFVDFVHCDSRGTLKPDQGQAKRSKPRARTGRKKTVVASLPYAALPYAADMPEATTADENEDEDVPSDASKVLSVEEHEGVVNPKTEPEWEEWVSRVLANQDGQDVPVTHRAVHDYCRERSLYDLGELIPADPKVEGSTPAFPVPLVKILRVVIQCARDGRLTLAEIRALLIARWPILAKWKPPLKQRLNESDEEFEKRKLVKRRVWDWRAHIRQNLSFEPGFYRVQTIPGKKNGLPHAFSLKRSLSPLPSAIRAAEERLHHEASSTGKRKAPEVENSLESATKKPRRSKKDSPTAAPNPGYLPQAPVPYMAPACQPGPYIALPQPQYPALPYPSQWMPPADDTAALESAVAPFPSYANVNPYDFPAATLGEFAGAPFPCYGNVNPSDFPAAPSGFVGAQIPSDGNYVLPAPPAVPCHVPTFGAAELEPAAFDPAGAPHPMYDYAPPNEFTPPTDIFDWSNGGTDDGTAELDPGPLAHLNFQDLEDSYEQMSRVLAMTDGDVEWPFA